MVERNVNEYNQQIHPYSSHRHGFPKKVQPTNPSLQFTLSSPLHQQTKNYEKVFIGNKYWRSPSLSILFAMVAVSPKRRNRGVFIPTQPATTGPDRKHFVLFTISFMEASQKVYTIETKKQAISFIEASQKVYTIEIKQRAIGRLHRNNTLERN